MVWPFDFIVEEIEGQRDSDFLEVMQKISPINTVIRVRQVRHFHNPESNHSLNFLNLPLFLKLYLFLLF